MRIYAIGDIHGQLEMLEAAHTRIARDRLSTGDDAAPVVHLGDLVDRGPDSRGVIELLVRGLARGEPWIVLRGNHDEMFLRQLDVEPDDRYQFRSWYAPSMGGADTVWSYGVTLGRFTPVPKVRRALREAIPPEHVAFLEGLAYAHETPELIFVHAGIRPGLPLAEQIPEDLMWIRRDFLDDPRDHDKLIVHGHTPVAEPMHCGNRVNLDTGAGYGRALTAAVFEGRECCVLEEDVRRPLAPLV